MEGCDDDFLSAILFREFIKWVHMEHYSMCSNPEDSIKIMLQLRGVNKFARDYCHMGRTLLDHVNEFYGKPTIHFYTKEEYTPYRIGSFLSDWQHIFPDNRKRILRFNDFRDGLRNILPYYTYEACACNEIQKKSQNSSITFIDIDLASLHASCGERFYEICAPVIRGDILVRKYRATYIFHRQCTNDTNRTLWFRIFHSTTFGNTQSSLDDYNFVTCVCAPTYIKTHISMEVYCCTNAHLSDESTIRQPKKTIFTYESIEK